MASANVHHRPLSWLTREPHVRHPRRCPRARAVCGPIRPARTGRLRPRSRHRGTRGSARDPSGESNDRPGVLVGLNRGASGEVVAHTPQAVGQVDLEQLPKQSRMLGEPSDRTRVSGRTAPSLARIVTAIAIAASDSYGIGELSRRDAERMATAAIRGAVHSVIDSPTATHHQRMTIQVRVYAPHRPHPWRPRRT